MASPKLRRVKCLSSIVRLIEMEQMEHRDYFEFLPEELISIKREVRNYNRWCAQWGIQREGRVITRGLHLVVLQKERPLPIEATIKNALQKESPEGDE
jgi:hypothetical protein